MKRRFTAAGVALVAALSLTACSGGGSGDEAAADGPITLTLSGWSVSTTPEFQALADAFHEKDPDVTVEVKEYDATNYDTLMTADLAAGSGPDIVTQKNVKNVVTYQAGGQLMDVSDVALPDGIGGAEAYEVDDTQWAVPYRQDSWVLFYNKDLFDQAGVAYPDGSWTWDDYADNAEALKTALAAAGSPAAGTYEHSWQSTVQGFANAQAPDVDILDGDYGYLEEYYDRALALQEAGAQAEYNTVVANKLTYQAEFGKQNAAMMPMGTWFVASLIAQQASGDSDTFNWGIAPIPQFDSSTAGTDNTPVTFGDPTGFAINAAIDSGKATAAKEFLEFASSEEGAEVVASLGITPALTSDAVTEAYFAVDSAPTDDLSKFAWSTHETKPENPTSAKTAAVQNILLDLHTAVMSGSASIGDAVTTAEDRVKSEVGTD
ncbi:extracellular solute-binding protein [Rathayibacter oskolensis]|uniref:ABC transporter substrate-binding protein n=1 Tax=Rathayibacter TaxID=33886 RepID=UPI0013192725|nr:MULTISPECIES: extracellular solute-binding protein [Rathayibacter]QHC67854.1 extracellular solute-binding protein [Rathayibacter sp. VKM Ac-2759]WKK72333.1 extracellular solute-binding protein [Rathayibacter oskolensis]